MKVALLADIHANYPALRAVLDAANREQVKTYLIAGDFIGYYYNIKEVIGALEEISYSAICGNHEDMFREWIKKPASREAVRKKYGSSFDLCTNLELDKFLNLPEQIELTLDKRKVLLCHGSPWDHDQYVYPDASSDIIEKFYEYDKDLIIFGHSHYPSIWKKNNRMVVNPGSVGQTRDHMPGACWALWDTTTNQVELKRETYDPSSVIEDCKKYDPELKYNQRVLLRARPE